MYLVIGHEGPFSYHIIISSCCSLLGWGSVDVWPGVIWMD